MRYWFPFFLSALTLVSPLKGQARETPWQLSSQHNPITTDSQLQLYGGPRTRASIIQWYLGELDIPYQYISLDIASGENLKPEFLAINPIGRVPAIVHGDLKLWESGAILLYLANLYQPTSDLQEQAKISQWVLFANATLGPGLFIPERRIKEIPRLLAPLEEILSQQQFLLAEKLTVADVAVGSYLYYAQYIFQLNLSQYPAVVAYIERLSARPAFAATLGTRKKKQ